MINVLGALTLGFGTTLGAHALLTARNVKSPSLLSPIQGLATTRSNPRVIPGERSRRDALGAVEGTPEAIRRLMVRQVIATIGTGLLAALLVGSEPTPIGVIAALSAVGGAWQIPLVLARGRERQRRTNVDRKLTDAIGEMVMGVEAGLTLDAVMARYTDRHTNDLAREFAHLAAAIRSGRSRTEALTEMRDRTPTPILRSFVSAVEQNVVLGTPLAAVLRKQAETTHRHRRQAAETRAAGVSMKMIFPTVFCLLPLLMIVVVGPAIVRLVEVL